MHEGASCITYDMLGCDCQDEKETREADQQDSVSSRPCQLGNRGKASARKVTDGCGFGVSGENQLGRYRCGLGINEENHLGRVIGVGVVLSRKVTDGYGCGFGISGKNQLGR